jgi:hypothetical protein
MSMRLLFLFAGVLVSAFALISPVSAQQPTSISITPLRSEGEIAPGFVYSGSFTVTNRGVSSREVGLSAETFAVINPAYDYVFKTNTPETSWVTFDRNSVVLKKDESATIRYEVSIPIGTEPGGYYLALFATNQLDDENLSGITPTERVASLLYLNVTGEASRVGTLVQLTSPSVVFSSADWSAVLQNTGTLHYRSNYSASVYTLFGHKLSTHEDSRLILPSSVRLIENSLKLPEVLGIYKVTYTIGLGDSPAEQHTRWFLYLPPLQTALVLIILVGLFVLIKKRRT